MKKIIKKSIMVFAVAALLIASLSGCGKSGGSGVSGSGTRILMTLHDDTDTFLNTLVEGMNQTASSMGVTLDIVYCGGDPAVQKQQVEKAVSDGYDAIICRLADAI